MASALAQPFPKLSAQRWSTLQTIPKGQRGTLETLRRMAWFCRRDAASQEVRDVALAVIGHLPGHDFENEVRALFFFVRDQITYRRDPVTVERVQDALRTLEYGCGDCDDKTVLLVSLLAVCGHPARFVVSGPKVGQWRHVYCEVQTKRNGQSVWLPLDVTPERSTPGWEPKAAAKAVFTIWPNVASALRVVRKPQSGTPSQQVRTLPARRQVSPCTATASVFSALPAYLANRMPCPACKRLISQLPVEVDGEDEALGADTYEWKESGGKCTLQKKKCGLFCKIGRAFKTIGKYALMVAPIALAPFTAGGSLALTGAAGTAVTISSAAASAASSLIQQRYTGSLPNDAKIEEPSGNCKRILEQEAAEEARKIAEQEQAKREAEERVKAEAQKAKEQLTQLQAAQTQGALKAVGQGGALGSLTSNPMVLAALIVGGALLLTR